MKKWKLFLGIAALAALIMLPVTAVRAFDVKNGNNIIVESGETVNGNLYAAGTQVVVDGTVNGDVFCAGSTITVNGTVNGDVLCAGSSITVNGDVKGDVRAASSELSVNGNVGGGLTAFGSAINVNNGASIGSNVLAFGASMRADGPINGDLQFFGASLLLNNKVAGDVIFYGENRKNQKNGPAVTLRAGTIIGGNLSYYEGAEATVSDGASIGGETIIKEVKKHEPKSGKEMLKTFPIWFSIWSILGGLIIAMVLVFLFPKNTAAALEVMFKKPAASIGLGLVAVILTPIIIVLLLITVIGIPIGILALVLFIAMCGLVKVLTGIAVGALLAKWLKWKISLYWQAVIGIILAVLIFAIPFIGWVLGLIAFLWAFGGAVMYKRQVYKKLEG
ncbi:MAG: polymer-forming cytoskeletal protein [Patescibacteria group bacterium]|jgi:cytoskeletal protein CcmA (bactofilin family)